MKIANLIRILVEEHGAFVRTENHIQVQAGEGWHNIWTGKNGLKLQMRGQREAESLSPESLLRKIADYQFGSTDLGEMQTLNRFLKKIEGRTGVFADAGWKSGQAKAALVLQKTNGDADILIRKYAAKSSTDAEFIAIKMAWHAWGKRPVISDCRGAVEMANEQGIDADWMGRDQLKEVDRIGNMRS